MTERVCILGASGMVGAAWEEELRTEGVAHQAFTRAQLDITQKDQLAKIGKEFDLVVNCAAHTQVDQAETDYAAAALTNGEAVGHLADHCADIGARLIHYSTDYVFDGKGQAPYPTDAKRLPVNAYGRSKLLGEQRIEASSVRALLIRTSWVYAPTGKNFVLTMAQLLRTKPQLRVVHDQRGRPTSAIELAKNSWRLARAVEAGVFHLTDGGECTWFEFACEIRNSLGLATPVEPCSSDEYPRPAVRPAYSVLDLSRSETVLGPIKPWQEALGETLDAVRGAH